MARFIMHIPAIPKAGPCDLEAVNLYEHLNAMDVGARAGLVHQYPAGRATPHFRSA
jgi:hypothetical protein